MPTILRGQELLDYNEQVKARYPKLCWMLQCAFCCTCVHRGKYRGCEFGLLPLTLDNKTCGIFRAWHPWSTSGALQRAAKLMCIGCTDSKSCQDKLNK